MGKVANQLNMSQTYMSLSQPYKFAGHKTGKAAASLYFFLGGGGLLFFPQVQEFEFCLLEYSLWQFGTE